MESLGGPLILLGSARSGTTLLQRILNSYKDVIVWGEHGGILEQVADSYFSLLESESMSQFSYPQAKGNFVSLQVYKNPEQWQAWNNWFRPPDVTAAYRSFLIDLFLSSWKGSVKYWGFKEIRYGTPDRVVDMFVSAFPDTKVLIVYRNPINVIDSQLSAFHNIGGRLERLRKLLFIRRIVRMSVRWSRLNRQFIRYKTRFPDNVSIIKYENMISGREDLEATLRGLGLSFGRDQEKVLELKSGRGSAYSSNKIEKSSSRWKSLGLIPATLIFFITKETYKALNELCP